MRILGIDYGAKRIGVAIGESDVRLAFWRDALQGTGAVRADAEKAFAFFKDEGCELLLLGLPLLESGEEGEQAAITRDFGAALEELGAKVIYWDERYSTSQARRSLEHLSPGKRKEALDSEAARLLVAEYLASSDA